MFCFEQRKWGMSEESGEKMIAAQCSQKWDNELKQCAKEGGITEECKPRYSSPPYELKKLRRR